MNHFEKPAKAALDCDIARIARLGAPDSAPRGIVAAAEHPGTSA
jgi:hypothetical protein